MTEEQNKLAWEIERRGLGRWINEQGIARLVDAEREILAALRNREPATEAVRGTMSEVTAPVTAAPGAFNLNEFVNAADIGGADSPHQVVYKLQRAINTALKGKGASQGDEALRKAIESAPPGDFVKAQAPEPSGEFVRVPREPTKEILAAMVEASVAHDKLCESAGWDGVRRSERIYRALLSAADEQKG